ncbi:hypothetical protein ACQKDS_14850 [Serratia sp. NPDC078593]|uniref:hypothetical protein n=1 Tax=unclassified Serratia (in: enterobacteria) TaxID=2647522 RepID=UPI0037D07567
MSAKNYHDIWFKDSTKLVEEFNEIVPREFIKSDEYKRHVTALNEVYDIDENEVNNGFIESIAGDTFDKDCEYFFRKYEEFFIKETVNYSEVYSSIWNNVGYKEGTFCHFLNLSAVELCRRLRVSKLLFFPLAFEIILHVIQERNDEAFALYMIMFYPIRYAEDKANFASKLGKTGGRPTHEHKEETISIAKGIIEKNPNMSVDAVCAIVYQEIYSKYTKPPSLASVRRWVNDKN